MTDRIDAAMEAVEDPGTDPVADRRRGDAEPKQLTPADDAVLA